jgi:Spy/CpxP family protein refolding chaperone
MKNISHRTYSRFLFIFLFLLAVSSWAGGKHHPGKKHMHSPMKMLLKPEVVEKLGLSEEQQQKLREATHQSHILMIDLKAEEKKAQADLHYQFSQTQPNRKEILAIRDRLIAVEAKITTERIDQMLKLMEVLTPEQKATWDKMVRSFGKKKHGKRPDRFGPQNSDRQGPPPPPMD